MTDSAKMTTGSQMEMWKNPKKDRRQESTVNPKQGGMFRVNPKQGGMFRVLARLAKCTIICYIGLCMFRVLANFTIIRVR